MEQLTNLSLTQETFQRLSAFISDELGIKMPDAKKTMLQGRLMKRLRKLKMRSFEDYCDYVFSPQGKSDELAHMLDAVTTNKTDFFREPKHYDILTHKVLPELTQSTSAGLRRPLALWSAGCSTGAEPYTLAMVLEEFAQIHPGYGYKIHATDISTRVLIKAREAIYNESEAEPVPESLKKKYLLRSKNRRNGLVRIVPELRSRVQFSRLNFMDSDYAMPAAMDIIFCRNVLIYFDRPTQQKVLSGLCRYLRKGGFLFTGHSETLNGFHLPLRQVTTTVYTKQTDFR